jgi:hypothetical protein
VGQRYDASGRLGKQVAKDTINFNVMQREHRSSLCSSASLVMDKINFNVMQRNHRKMRRCIADNHPMLNLSI